MVKKATEIHQKELERIKDNVGKSYDYFRENYKRFYKSKRFLYVDSIEDDRKVLKSLSKPELEFNILEAYVSRQKGEFSKQEPSIKVEAAEGQQVNPQLIEVIEGYIRHIECKMRSNKVAYNVYDDMLAGGFSVVKVYADYAHDMSFDQDIFVERVFDPTLCGFDPLAMKPSKADGEYCFELSPLTEEEFKKEYPDIDTSKFRLSDNFKEFAWSYKNAQTNEKLILRGDYYEKKKKSVKIVQLTNKQVMPKDKYEKELEKWQLSGNIEQPPQIIQERSTFVTTIVRYRLVEDRVLSYEETSYSQLPLIFFDGNSTIIRKNLQSPVEQFTRPYCYQARGIQRLKNFCGQTLAAEIENMIQHKFKVPLEGIPPQYADPFKDYQTASVLIYNQYMDDNPDKPLNPPQEIVRVPTPPEVAQTFAGADQTTQAILGSYDAALGINKNELSGKAIIEGATQSNAASMPYIVGYLNGFSQVAKFILDLIPKLFVTPRTIPILGRDGKRHFVEINGNQQTRVQYESSSLNVNVEAGVNFSIQKSRAVQQIVALMSASDMFKQFVNGTPEGLSALLDNLEMRGIDRLKQGVEQFFQKQQQQPPQPNPVEIEAKIEGAKIAVSDKNADTQRIKVLGELGAKQADREIKVASVQAEEDRAAVDMAMHVTDMSHRHNKEAIETTHNILSSIENKPQDVDISKDYM